MTAATSTSAATGILGDRRGSPNSRASAGTPIQGASAIIVRPSQPIVSPRPSCSPAVTDCGISRATRPIRPVAPSISRAAPTASPAAAAAPGVNCPVSSTALIAFMGCTAMGRR